MSSWAIANEEQRQLLPTLTKALQPGDPHQWIEQSGDVAGLLDRAANLGAFALLVPEEDGGGSWSEQPILDAGLATAILGTDLAPIPLPEIAVAAALLAACPASNARADLLGGHAAGEALCLVPFRVEGAQGRSTTPTLVDGRLTGGRATFIGVAGAAYLLVLVVQEGQSLLARLELADVLGQAVRLESLDLTRSVWQLDLADLPIADEQLQPVAEPAVRRAQALGTALVCAEVVAAIDTLLATAVEYSLTREAFGQVIGGFQAIKHLLADARMQLEGAKAVTVAAIEACADDAVDPVEVGEVAAIAKVYVDERAVPIALDCLQVFGGIGFSWEHQLHLFLRRAAARGGAFGTRAEHLRAIDDLHITEWEVAP